MAAAMVCPSCGEGEELRGEQAEGDIEVTCLTCGTRWMRGGVRCANCGGQDIVHRPQAMTRHSQARTSARAAPPEAGSPPTRPQDSALETADIV